MAAKRFEVELPEEVVTWFGGQETEVPYKVREALVMELLRRHVISQGKAAELLQLNPWDLSDVMGRYQVPAIDMTPEEVRRELAKRSHQVKGYDRGRCSPGHRLCAARTPGTPATHC